jgi:hypothetical protein
VIYVELVDGEGSRHWHDIMSDEFATPTVIESVRGLLECEFDLSDIEEDWKLVAYEIKTKPIFTAKPFGPIVVDTPEMIRADAVQVGDLLDLEGDPHADPEKGGGIELPTNSFEFELAEVTEVVRETADCIRIGGPGFLVGFPVDHMLKRMGHDNRIEAEG